MFQRLTDWRILWAAAVFALAMTAFSAGVETSQRLGADSIGGVTHVYYALILFFGEGAEIGAPTGGPAWARSLLWIAYFAAPALTISAIIEAVFGVLNPGRWRLRSISDHTIVVGTGALPRATLEILQTTESDGPVVVVVPSGTEQPPDGDAEDLETILVEDDPLDADLLDRLHIDRADRVLLMSPHDCNNLELAARITGRYDENTPWTLAHVSDLGMLRELKRSALLGPVEVFNGHQLAARQLVETKLLEHFEQTGPDDQVVLAGFGRFGQTVLKQLQDRAAPLIARVLLVDLEVDAKAMLFDDQVGFVDTYDTSHIRGDLDDPRTWRSIEEALDPDAAPPVFVLGVRNEDLNLRAAMLQWARHPEALFVVRSYYHPSLADRMDARGDFELDNVADLLRSGLAELVDLSRATRN